ncbi:rhox homeobox family member 1-like [Acomys russatus]|uniref:rhox homeobox family member 1-like n=1 Tax=Acomys russatus TaxID=60746 RepID=UPI0021E28940|nr:rhox homeobox family member 1-like [Acomys russatus]
MARKYFYFDYDFYGVSFYEEEILTESEERVTNTATCGSLNKGVGDTPNELFCEGHQSSEGDQGNQGGDMKNNTWNTEQEEPKVASNLARTSEQPSFRVPRKPYKFTPGQLWELEAVFEETQYPDANRRRELAWLMNVDEQKVKDWFNNKRAKLRKNQREVLRGQFIAPNQHDCHIKIVVETQRIIFL